MSDHISEPLGLWAQLACVWEATARKPGNVHRLCDFKDVTYLEFIASAAAIAPAFEQAPGMCVGDLVLDAVQRTREVVMTNTNLGIILLLAPLAVAPGAEDLPRSVEKVLARLTVTDAVCAYEAIRLATPSGLGRVASQDIAKRPTVTLREAMAMAAERDMIARQYANGFREVFADAVPAHCQNLAITGNLELAIIACHLQLLAQHQDSLIVRKCGVDVAGEASRRAAEVLAVGWPDTEAGQHAIADLDAWLRADGHRRNPGTTADLVTASLFVALRQGIIKLPLQVPWSK